MLKQNVNVTDDFEIGEEIAVFLLYQAFEEGLLLHAKDKKVQPN